MNCPQCGGDGGFEKRGDVRRYISLDPDTLAEASWHDSDDVDTDRSDNGDEVIYCLDCDSELSEEELLTAT